MLTYPNRQRFEQIRAQWETAQPSEEGQAEMAGWRDKPTPQQPTSVESNGNGASKFRRKLSHSFSSLISNPLSQRKVTPGRDQLEAPLLAVTDSLATDASTATLVCDAPVLPAHKSVSLIDLVKTARGKAEKSNTHGPAKSVDAHATLKPLPRSCTLGFIPLPVKPMPNVYTADIDGVVKADLPAPMSQPEFESVPTKIPSPSPEIYEHRCYSPRRYIHHHAVCSASKQDKHVAASYTFTRANNSSPRTAAAKNSQPLQSRATQNAVKGSNKLQTARFMAPRKPGPRRSVAAQTSDKPVLQENIPMDKRVTSKRSQTQERELKRESLSVAGTLYDRRSFGESTPVMQGKGTSFATPPTASKRIISHNSQNTPVTVKRIQRGDQVVSQTPNRLTIKSGPVPKLSMLDTSRTPILHGVEPSKQSLLRSCTQTDLLMKTSSKPNSLSDVSRPARAFGAVNPEVSKLPRSQTFHNFGSQLEDTPPVPPLPGNYKKSSISGITRQYHMMHDIPTKPCHGRMRSDATLCRSIIEENSGQIAGHDSKTVLVEAESAPSRSDSPASSIVSSTVFPLTSNALHHPKLVTTSTSNGAIPSSEDPSGESPGDFREQAMPDVANTAFSQVGDYMPPQYWAGRFQSRYDQWRTDAMNAELDIQSGLKTSCPLSIYKLDQENLVVCHILAQLRDLCISDKAADSLWVFEHKYRKDNKLLSNLADRPTRPWYERESKTAPAEAETGALGRAIKKLTPRKSSLANLMKVTGWNKADESKQHNRSEES
ncbi:uncharacterized protein yc1106_01254 [Curvularia clavata]|uniref:Uncharacterized protein n=1 Tax=Curvularia clavata TaxID=95742 RepID=A0A9Q8Z1K2_CURCL|nr:uncharacterized protein yc1106_01254 [Curvularia clavata]